MAHCYLRLAKTKKSFILSILVPKIVSNFWWQTFFGQSQNCSSVYYCLHCQSMTYNTNTQCLTHSLKCVWNSTLWFLFQENVEKAEVTVPKLLSDFTLFSFGYCTLGILATFVWRLYCKNFWGLDLHGIIY